MASFGNFLLNQILSIYLFVIRDPFLVYHFFFPFAKFILSIFEEGEKNFRNKRLVDNLERGKWQFFIESDSFEFFFSLFDFLVIFFLSQNLSSLRKNSRDKRYVDNLEKEKQRRLAIFYRIRISFFRILLFVTHFFEIWRSFFSFRKIYFINFKKEFSGQETR